MAATKTGASRSRGASVTSNGKPKTITIKGLKLTLPPTVQLGSIRGLLKDDGTIADVVGFLEIVLGEEQMEKVWAIDLDLSDGPLGNQVRALLDDLSAKVSDEIGLAPGE